MLTENELQAIKPVRYMRRIWDDGGLHLRITPKGERHWSFVYRFAGKRKALSFGHYPSISLECARSRRAFALNLLDHGLDPSALKVALGKHLFVVTMREWEIARGYMSGNAGHPAGW